MSDPHADDFCVVCGRHPEPGLLMHPVVGIENGTVCGICVQAVEGVANPFCAYCDKPRV